jgi:uncharacterized protein YdbL (DUF1318 family)
MKLHVDKKTVCCSLLVLLTVLPSAAPGQSKAELRESMKERYPQLQKLRDQGKIGETYRGYVEAVTRPAVKDKEIQTLIKAENADRRSLYDIIAQDVGTTPEAVGRINAQRILEEAGPEMFYKTSEGAWTQKKDLDVSG